VRLTKIGGTAGKWLHVITAANKWLCFITFCAMALITTADIIGRYVIHLPVPGSIELVTTLMLVLVYSIFAYVTEVDFNIRVDVVYVKLSKRTQYILDVISSILCVLMAAVTTWQIWLRTYDVGFLHKYPDLISAVLPWSLWPFAFVATIGCAVMVLELFVWFLRSVKNLMNKETAEPVEKSAKPETIL
jgi:TRAP-type C4-dicarboxylate transport system permease small subunit